MSKIDKEIDFLLGPAPVETAMVGGAFDAAARNQRTLETWQPALNSADVDLIPAKADLDARSRDSLRNDAYVQGGATIYQDNIVGSLYALNAKPMGKVLGKTFDDKWEEEFQEEVENRFTLYAESPDCWMDASRHNTFTDMVRLAVGVHTATGETLASAEWMKASFGRPFRTALQFIDTDRLANPPTAYNTANMVGGVEKDKYGAPIRYHVRMQHPSDFHMPDHYKWKAVNARKAWGRVQMIHIFEQQRPDQTRGVAMMVSALKEMRITKQFRDVTLQNAVVNATYAASIESDLPSAEAFATLGGQDNIAGAMNEYVGSYLNQIATYSGGAKNLRLDGVKIPHLFPGTKLNLHQAGKGGPLGQEFEQSLLRYIAAALGVSYEQLSKDYSQTNYSSARAAMAETWKRMNVVKRQVADRFANIGYRLWLEEAINMGAISSLPAEARQAGWLYSNQRLDALSQCDWIGASKGQIDELKETQAAVLRLKYNLSTDEDEIARLGKDWRVVKKQRAREKAMDVALDLNVAEDTTTPGAVDTAAQVESGEKDE
ncbi:phage portal protein [Sulfitobacter pontiacus]